MKGLFHSSLLVPDKSSQRWWVVAFIKRLNHLLPEGRKRCDGKTPSGRDKAARGSLGFPSDDALCSATPAVGIAWGVNVGCNVGCGGKQGTEGFGVYAVRVEGGRRGNL